MGEEHFVLRVDAAIDTREELIAALALAAEVEHSLLVQYLFAGYSLKKRPEGISERQVELARSWAAVLLAVAREEMVHLATVTKLTSAVGGSPHLSRPEFPRPAEVHYPFEMRLHRFSANELARFIRFETPADAAPVVTLEIAPDVPEWDYLGELYSQIKQAFLHLASEYGEDWLFVGPETRDAEDWGLNHEVRAIADVQSAAAAIDEIIVEGEGAPTAGERSHWFRFRAIQSELQQELAKSPGFEPARRVAPNPRTRAGDGESSGTLLPPGSVAADLGELFNHLYTSILMMIAQFYAPVGENAEQRRGIQATLRRSMSGILRPVAETLTELSFEVEGREVRAGPPFETYGLIEPPTSVVARFAVLDERLTRAAEEAIRIAREADLDRVRFLGENIALMHEAVRRVRRGEEVGNARPRF